MCDSTCCPGPCYDFCDCDHCYLGWKIPVRNKGEVRWSKTHRRWERAFGGKWVEIK